MLHKVEKLPIVDADGILKGLITIKDIQKVMEFSPGIKDAHGRLRVGAAIGSGMDALERAAALVKAGVDVIIVDTAHGHSSRVIETVRRVRAEFSDMRIIAGNVATAEATDALITAGADGIKVGVGPGSICTTRIIAGIGVPQLTAVVNASARRA
jgi:IMP dehydrogenase